MRDDGINYYHYYYPLPTTYYLLPTTYYYLLPTTTTTTPPDKLDHCCAQLMAFQSGKQGPIGGNPGQPPSSPGPFARPAR